jgi:hypothetical protein
VGGPAQAWRYRNVEMAPRGGKAYRIRRQPTSNLSPSRSSAEAIQFPRGVGIDFDVDESNVSAGILFSPNGSVEAIFRDGMKFDPNKFGPWFIMLGRSANANPMLDTNADNDIDFTRYDFSDQPDDDVLEERRQQLNLLNADSRWVTVTPSGRIVGSENYVFDPRLTEYVDGTPPDTSNDPKDQRRRQREAARQYARNLESESGG